MGKNVTTVRAQRYLGCMVCSSIKSSCVIVNIKDRPPYTSKFQLKAPYMCDNRLLSLSNVINGNERCPGIVACCTNVALSSLLFKLKSTDFLPFAGCDD